MRGNKDVNLHLRISQEAYRRICSFATPEISSYRIMRDAITARAYSNDTSVDMSQDAIAALRDVADRVGYISVDALMVDLAQSFLKVWQYHNGELDDDEPTPSEEIRDMFATMSNGMITEDPNEKGYSISRRI